MSDPSEPSPNPAAAPPVQLNLDTQGLAETYDRLGFRQFDHGKLLIADLEVLPGHRVLDIGSGTGLLGEYVADQVGPRGLVVGIDPLPHRIEVARRRAAGNFRVQLGRAEDLSAFPAASFDIAYFNSVFHWISDKPAALREAARVLKSSGRLGISTAAREQPHDLEQVFVAAFGAESRLGRAIPHKVDSGELAGLFAHAGLATARLEIRTLTDRFADVDEVLAFNISSSFGNAFAGLDPAGRGRVREILDRALDRHRLEDGSIRLQRHLIFAVARKA
jgi:ubiquinone/menaquinone biosynthesis C-methylase UbiE